MTPDKTYFVSGVSCMTGISKTKSRVQDPPIELETTVRFAPARSWLHRCAWPVAVPHIFTRTSRNVPPAGTLRASSGKNESEEDKCPRLTRTERHKGMQLLPLH
jgi:hypothetical protein